MILETHLKPLQAKGCQNLLTQKEKDGALTVNKKKNGRKESEAGGSNKEKKEKERGLSVVWGRGV